MELYYKYWSLVKEGDLTTNGTLSSSVPSGALFNTVGSGGFPGVAIFGTSFNLSSTPERISSTVWNANTTTSQTRLFNYSYFKNLIPSDVVFNDVSTLATGGTTYSDGYEWYKKTGDLTISSNINFGNRKVILFVESGNLNISGKINLNDGVGFFASFVDGNTTVAGTVTGSPALEGMYLTNGTFSTGGGSTQFHVRGSVASFGGMALQRSLLNNSTGPAELFEFAPDQLFLYPQKLMFLRTKWNEVAP